MAAAKQSPAAGQTDSSTTKPTTHTIVLNDENCKENKIAEGLMEITLPFSNPGSVRFIYSDIDFADESLVLLSSDCLSESIYTSSKDKNLIKCAAFMLRNDVAQKPVPYTGETISFTFRLLDRYGAPIKFPSASWTIVLEFETR
jgi:hypothetical protein